MTGREFLPLARSLARGDTEAEWRTAVSRAYYAAFHTARDLLASLRFTVPQADPLRRRADFAAYLRDLAETPAPPK